MPTSNDTCKGDEIESKQAEPAPSAEKPPSANQDTVDEVLSVVVDCLVDAAVSIVEGLGKLYHKNKNS